MRNNAKDILKRVTALGMGILLAGSLVACSSGSDTSSTTAAATTTAAVEAEAAADEGGTGASEEAGTAAVVRQPLTVVTTSDAGGLAPYGVNRGGKQCIRSAMYEPLFWMDEDKNMCPVLAKSYEYKGNGVYDVELFDYIYDSAGEHLTAPDVVFSIDRMIDEGHAGSYVGSLSEYTALDDYTVELVFGDEAIGNFETLVTNLYCVTEASWEASGDEMVTNPIGTGLYVCTNSILGSEYDFAARDDYWQTDPDYICAKNTCNVDPLILRVINDTSTIAIALENGEIDYTMNIEEADRDNFVDENGDARDGYSVKELMNASLIRISYNCSELSPCQDINLRKALAYCIDNEACAYTAQKSYGHAARACINPGYLDADSSVNDLDDYYDYNVEKAKECLAQSSYNGETLRVLVEPNDNCTSSAVLFQAYAREIGVNLELIEYDSAVFGDYFQKNDGEDYDMTLFGINSSNSYTWKGLYELDINQFGNGLNQLAIYDEKLQDLYDTAASASTNSVQTANDLIEYVTDQCYEYALFYYNTCYVGLDKIKDIVVGAGNAESIYNAFVIE